MCFMCKIYKMDTEVYIVNNVYTILEMYIKCVVINRL